MPRITNYHVRDYAVTNLILITRPLVSPSTPVSRSSVSPDISSCWPDLQASVDFYATLHTVAPALVDIV